MCVCIYIYIYTHTHTHTHTHLTGFLFLGLWVCQRSRSGGDLGLCTTDRAPITWIVFHKAYMHQVRKGCDSFFTFMWPYIVTNFFVIKPTRCTNFTDLFWHETVHVSDSVCLCVCVCVVCVCVYICIYIYTHTHTHTHTNTNTHNYIRYKSLHIGCTLYIYCRNTKYLQHIHAFIHAYIHTRVHAQIRVSAYLYSRIKYLHTYIHTYVYTHTHTHTHIYIYIYIPTYEQSNYILSQLRYVSKHTFKTQFHTILVSYNYFVHDDSLPKNTYALLVSHTEFLQY